MCRITRSTNLFACTAILALSAAPAWAQDDVDVMIAEGTNIAAAVSPNGQSIAFDALGRIWVMPMAGGTATPLTDPFGDARQPAWSPDANRIAFQAYWDGNYHIWSVGADGAHLRQHTSGPYDHREPHWSPDGARIAFSSDRRASYDIWELEIATGAVTRLTDSPGNEYGPAYGPDGRRIAYAADLDNLGVWIREANGSVRRVVDMSEGAVFAPSWSPDGERIAYNHLTPGHSEMMIAAVFAGSAPTRLSDPSEDVFPFRVSWTADGGTVYTSDGHIWARGGGGRNKRDIDFQATVTLHRAPYTRRPRDLDAPGPLPVRGIVSPALSPDGESVAFSALGDLWVMPIGQSPTRITDDPWIETDPAWSPDGTRLVYATDRAGAVSLWIRDMETGADRQLTTEAGGTMPTWSPDGRRIAFAGRQGPEIGIQLVDVETGDARTVRRGFNGVGRPTWLPNGGEIAVSVHSRYSTRFREGVNRVLILPVDPVSAARTREGTPRGRVGPGGTGWGWDGTMDTNPTFTLQQGERMVDFVPHGSVGIRGTDGPVWSPDGKWMAYVSAGLLWAVPVTPTGDAAGPARRLTNEIADDPSWSGDSRSILYIASDRLRRVWLYDGHTDDIPVDLTWEREQRTGTTLVRAGALFDGVSDGLRRNVDIVIRGNRIVEVAETDPARTADRIVDASDGVVVPGFIEMHTHGGMAMGEQLGRLWLSFGVTSIRSPASDPYEIVEARESIAMGRRVGPRFFGTGGTIDGSRIYYAGAPSLSSTAQVELELERARALQHDMIKTYVRLADPVQRRVIEASHAMGLPVSSHELYPAVAYGADGVEHVKGTSRRGYSPKVSELLKPYDDVVTLLGASGMTLTPTVGIYGAYQLLASESPTMFDDPRVQIFFPWAPQAVGVPDDMETTRFLVTNMASMARRVVDAGGTVIVGTDSPIIPQGLSYHAEMEALVKYGGMRPIDVLRSGTSLAAAALGYEDALGKVAPGYYADLVVLNQNPLDDIRATRTTRVVVKDGRVFELRDLLERPSG